MRPQAKILVALDEGVEPAAVEAVLPVEASFQIGLVEGLDVSWRMLEESSPDLLVVTSGRYSERALLLIENAAKQKPERPVVVLATAPANGFMRRVFEAGADDLVVLPQSPTEVAFLFEKALARKQGASVAAGTALAPLVCVVGPKGGTGKTLTACNLAVALAEHKQRVALVDLDLQFGDVGLALRLQPERTLYDLARSGGSLDAEKIDAFLAEHPSGARALLAPTRPDQAGSVGADFLRDVYAALRQGNDFVLVDTPAGFTPETISAIDSSTGVCMVGMLDSLSLKDTKLGLETLEMMGYEAERTRLVLNRSGGRTGISPADVEAILGRRADVYVPSDNAVPRAVTEGRPIVLSKRHSHAARAFRALADLYLADVSPLAGQNGGKRRRLFRRSK